MTTTELQALVDEAPDADEALRAVVAALCTEPGITWAGVVFSETDGFVEGPSAGVPNPPRRTATSVVWQGSVVGELRVDGDADPDYLTRVAELVAVHVLLGWDTDGEAWEP